MVLLAIAHLRQGTTLATFKTAGLIGDNVVPSAYRLPHGFPGSSLMLFAQQI
jgi:hypothetical protein